jgi:hypothetical protein
LALIGDNGLMEGQPPPRHVVTIEVEGNLHKGTYWVAGQILTVSTGLGGKSKQVGTMGPRELAKKLLLELVKAGKA